MINFIKYISQTVKGMLENYIYLIQKYKFIPHANRLYFENSSQPPLFARMVNLYYTATNDIEFAYKAVEFMEIEYKSWDSVNSVTVGNYKLYSYGEPILGPRPDAYREDTLLVSSLTTDAEKQGVYEQIFAAVESGFAFSSRWFINNGTNSGSRIDTKCRSVVPVEMNSIFFGNLRIIASLYRSAGNISKAEEYDALALDLFRAIQAVLWNEEDKIWYDYDLINNKPRKYFSVTNFAPLLTRAYPIGNTDIIAESVLQYISDNKLDSYAGGVPTTLTESGEDWDYPNAWPQMQWLLIICLRNLNTTATNELAQSWAVRWLQTNYIVYDSVRSMYDKVSLKIL